MLSIRLSRVGKKKAPTYRIVVMPKQRDPWARSVEILGHYNPRKQPKELVVQADRIKYWISKGAQPTDTVWNLLVGEKIIEGEKRTSSHISKKRTAKIEEKIVEKKAKNEEAATKKVEAENAAKEEAATKKVEAENAAKEEAAAKKVEAETAKAAEEAKVAEAAPKEETPAESETKDETKNEPKEEMVKDDTTETNAAQDKK
jgi:small subunit ribosomal protein S16